MLKSYMGCGGQIPLPISFLQDACKIIYGIGGIFFADEIQVGFGRIGKYFGDSTIKTLNLIF